MITVSKKQLETVEYLLRQSAQGNHVLFDPDIVRQVFQAAFSPMSESQASEVCHHIENLILLDHPDKKRAYLDQLSLPVLHRVVRTYLNIVENNLFESGDLRH